MKKGSMIIPLLILITFVFSSAVLAQNQKPIDLNGKWKNSEGQEVEIKQSGQGVKAVFITNSECPNGGKREYYINGQLQDASLTGSMMRCTRDPHLVNDCGLSSVYTTTFKATVNQDKISGTWHTEWYDYDDSVGNCKYKRNSSRDHDENFSLTRTCETNKEKLCAAIDEALQATGYMASGKDVASTQSDYVLLRGYLIERLDRVRNEICDDKDAQNKIDQIKNMVESLPYPRIQGDVVRQNDVITQAALALKNLNAASCGETVASNCQEPVLEKAQLERLERAWDELKEELKKEWSRFQGYQSNAADNAEGYRTYMSLCGIGEVGEEVIESLVGLLGDEKLGAHGSHEAIELKNFVERLMEGAITAGEVVDVDLNDLWNTKMALTPESIRERIQDCMDKVPGDSLYNAALAYVNNGEDALEVLPEIHGLLNRMERLSEEYLSWQHKYYDACVAYAKCKGTDPGQCPKPPEAPGIPGKQ